MATFNVMSGSTFNPLTDKYEDRVVSVDADNAGTSDNGTLIFTNEDNSVQAVFNKNNWEYFQRD